MNKAIRLSPYGSAITTAIFKQESSDFQVAEIEKFTPQGSGEHLWLWVEKINLNTHFVAEQLAKQTHFPYKSISYAGRKDRKAITRQWFSIYDPKKKIVVNKIEITGATILESNRHNQKLRKGQLLGNYFNIKLCGINANFYDIDNRLKKIQSLGFPNYFGQQRFGHDNENLQRAILWSESKPKKISRNKQSIYFSSLRSYLFNQYLKKRVELNNWNQLIENDTAMFNDSNAVFMVEDIHSENERCKNFEIGPTGPLLGKQNKFVTESKSDTSNLANELEESLISDNQSIAEFLRKNTKQSRRRLRCLPKKFQWSWDGQILHLQFELPAGSYATVLLEQVFELIQKD